MSRTLKRDVRIWAFENLPGWKVQRNDSRDGWILLNPETASYCDWEYVKEVVDAYKKTLRGPAIS